MKEKVGELGKIPEKNRQEIDIGVSIRLENTIPFDGVLTAVIGVFKKEPKTTAVPEIIIMIEKTIQNITNYLPKTKGNQ